ncbi:uncharacterized protein LOC134929532 isoform X2 [Pseudophryne corroboree]
MALIRRKTLAKDQEIQEIQIFGYGDADFDAQDRNLQMQSPLCKTLTQGGEPCARLQKNEVATQTSPVFCFSSVGEIVEFLNSCSRVEDHSPRAPSFADDPLDESVEEVLTKEDHMRTLKLEMEEEDDDEDDNQPIVSHLYPNPPVRYASSSSARFPIIKRRRKQRFHCDWQGPAAVISSPNIPAQAMELRVDEDLALSIRRQVDINNPGPFGWQLAKLLFTEEELYGHNFNGTDQKMPLSPRRVHAIQHAFHDYFPKDIADEALAKGRTAINQGIRNMFYVRNRRDGDNS